MPRTKRAAQYGAQSGLAQQTSVQHSQHELLSLSSRVKRGQQHCLISQESDVESSGERNLPQKRIRRTNPLVLNQLIPLISPIITQNMTNSSSQVCSPSTQVNSDQTDLVNKLIRMQQETLAQLNTLLISQSRHTTNTDVSFNSTIVSPNDSHGISYLKPRQEDSDSHLKSEVDRLLKNLPKFKGGDDENFNSWMLNTKSGLKLSHCTEQEKINIILMKIEGYPREILENMGEFESVESIFEYLKPTYGKDQRLILASLRQLPDESVRLYSIRLKTNLKFLGIRSNDAAQSNLICLDYFVKGLIPAVAKRVKALLPDNLEIAEQYALQIEVENNTVQEGRQAKKHVENVNSMTESATEIDPKVNATLSAILKKLGDQNKAFKSVKDKVNSIVTKSSPLNNHRTYNGQCFGCKQPGHRYTDCTTTSPEDMAYIRKNFLDLLAEFRRHKARTEHPSNALTAS